MFEITPQAVVYPKNSRDVERLVEYVAANKAEQPALSITARSAGTDMSGGAINDSIIADFTKYFRGIGRVAHDHIRVEPGVYYRRFDRRTRRRGLLLPSYPASYQICTVGGMVANNSGGEKSLTYGKTINYVQALDVVLSDGHGYHLAPLDSKELAAKQKLKTFEGSVYRHLHKLIDDNYDAIQKARPHVSKNSTGYNLWDVWDRKTFDLTKLFVGSQGTLGLTTEITFRLVPVQPASGMLILYLPSLDHLGKLINTVLPLKPSSFEAFDDKTLGLALKFFPYFRKTLGWRGMITLALSFIPDVWLFRKGLPKLIVLVEFEGQSQAEVIAKLDQLKEQVASFDFAMTEAKSARAARRYWIIRRESFNLLRNKVKDKHTAPFIDDLVVPPAVLPEFLPKLKTIVDQADLLYSIAGHLGDGNFHIIPLMNFADPAERAKIPEVMKKVNKLVLDHGGSLSGEHNDGLVRGPFLTEMYGPKMMKIFRDTKKIFDPNGIFNPHKKAQADWDYSMDHLRQDF